MNFIMNKTIVILLILLFSIFQYKLWFTKGGVRETLYLKNQISEQQVQNIQLQERNSKVAADIKSLKENNSSIESRARKELGMVKNDETFYQTK